MSVISGLLPKTEAKPRSQAMTGYHTSKWDITGLYPIRLDMHVFKSCSASDAHAVEEECAFLGTSYRFSPATVGSIDTKNDARP